VHPHNAEIIIEHASRRIILIKVEFVSFLALYRYLESFFFVPQKVLTILIHPSPPKMLVPARLPLPPAWLSHPLCQRRSILTSGGGARDQMASWLLLE